MFDLNIRLASTTEVNRIEEALVHLIRQGERIMSVISDFVNQQNAYNDQIDAAIAGLTADVAALNDHIAVLQRSQTLSPDDVALLNTLSNRTKAVAEKLTGLDALTPPEAPVMAPPPNEPPTEAGSGGGPPVGTVPTDTQDTQTQPPTP